MHISRIRIERFRSAEHVELPQVGAFNVLIGKNNSGKSTVLLALESFFVSLRGEGLVSLSPPLGRKIDFTRQEAKKEITISVTFSLGAEERATLIQDIVQESPQLRNLTDSLAASLFLEVTVAVTPPPFNFSYVKSIRFSGVDQEDSKDWRVLLTVDPAAAQELAMRQRRIDQSNRTLNDFGRALETIDQDDFTRTKKESSEGPSYLMYRISRGRGGQNIHATSLQTIEQLIRNTDNFSDFRTSLANLREQAAAEVKKLSRDPLQNMLHTFSGDQSSIPGYAVHLLETLGRRKVLYLTERRDPVGRTEAEQLLDYKVTRGGPETLRGIQQKVEKLLGVKVDAFESNVNPGNERAAEMDVDDFLLEVNGSGVKEALRLILDAELKSPDLLLVEEPEVHLHPALETNMMRYLLDVSTKAQVFISTHSTNFLDSANAQNVYFVSKNQTGSSEVRLLNVGEAEGELPDALGIRLSSLFMFDKLVFVEALSDELILREFASTLGVNLSEANLGFIHIGGARNFTHFANETTFSFLKKKSAVHLRSGSR